VSIELRRGKTLYARERLAKVDRKVRQVVLRRRGGKKFPAGSYRLVVRGQGKVLLSRTVHVGKAG
jgi:poly(A) polymerase Pap1